MVLLLLPPKGDDLAQKVPHVSISLQDGGDHLRGDPEVWRAEGEVVRPGRRVGWHTRPVASVVGCPRVVEVWEGNQLQHLPDEVFQDGGEVDGGEAVDSDASGESSPEISPDPAHREGQSCSAGLRPPPSPFSASRHDVVLLNERWVKFWFYLRIVRANSFVYSLNQ